MSCLPFANCAQASTATSLPWKNLTSLVCWNSNFTIESNGNYDRLSPLLGYDQFREVMKCLYHLIYHKFPTINSAKIETGANLLTKSSTLTTSSYEGYLSECKMLDALASGNINRFNYAFRVFVKNGNFGKFGQTKLRNEKDMAIVATTLYTRSNKQVIFSLFKCSFLCYLA